MNRSTLDITDVGAVCTHNQAAGVEPGPCASFLKGNDAICPNLDNKVKYYEHMHKIRIRL